MDQNLMEVLGQVAFFDIPKVTKTCYTIGYNSKETKNMAEYEALIQGLKKAIDLNVKFLKFFGDS